MPLKPYLRVEPRMSRSRSWGSRRLIWTASGFQFIFLFLLLRFFPFAVAPPEPPLPAESCGSAITSLARSCTPPVEDVDDLRSLE